MSGDRPRMGVCQTILSNVDMASDLGIVVDAGLDAMAVSSALVEATGLDETRRLMGERGVVASSYLGGVSVLDMPDDVFDEALRAGLTRAAALGAPAVVVVSGSAGDLSPAAADDRVVARLSRFAPLGEELGVRMAIETLHPYFHAVSYVHTLGQAAALASRVPNCGVALDLVASYWDRDIHDAISQHVDLVTTVHVSNLSRTALERRSWARSQLDDGVVPLAGLLRALDAAGYRGFYENEVIGPPLAPDECRDALRAAGEWFSAVWDDD